MKFPQHLPRTHYNLDLTCLVERAAPIPRISASGLVRQLVRARLEDLVELLAREELLLERHLVHGLAARERFAGDFACARVADIGAERGRVAGGVLEHLRQALAVGADARDAAFAQRVAAAREVH